MMVSLHPYIEIAADSRTVIRCLLIVRASERQQIAALATQEFLLAPTSGARRLSSTSRPAKRGRCPTPMKARRRVGPYPTYGRSMRNSRGQFQLGHSGGRPKGARNRLAAQ